MKIHFAIGLLIGAAINLAFQVTDDSFAQLEAWELCLCALLAGVATLLPRAVARSSRPLVAARHER